MKTSAKCTILKNSAKTVLAGKYYFVIMTLLFSGMITLLFNRFAYNLNEHVCVTLINLLHLDAAGATIIALSYLLPFFLSILLNVMQVGICLYFLNVVSGNPFYTFDLLYGYHHEFGKSFRLSAALTFLSFVCFLPSDVMMDLYQDRASVNVGLMLFLAALQIALVILFIPLSLALSQSYYVMLDYPNLSVPEILKLSMKIMQGKKKQLFYVQLSFLPVFFVGILTFGFGLLWLIPYRNATMALYYLDLMRPTDRT